MELELNLYVNSIPNFFSCFPLFTYYDDPIDKNKLGGIHHKNKSMKQQTKEVTRGKQVSIDGITYLRKKSVVASSLEIEFQLVQSWLAFSAFFEIENICNYY